MRIKKSPLSILMICLLVISSCIHSNVYEKNVAIPSNKWTSQFKPVYTFNISDTTVSYKMSLTMRHTDAFPFSNIWLNVRTTFPGEKESKLVKVEIPLAQADGKWMGRGMNEIYEHQMPLTRDANSIRFTKKGEYKIQLEQIMRVDPLPEVMSIGVRLEKNQ